MTDIKEENKELGRLIDINKDAADFYDKALNEIESGNLKSTFSNLREIHNQVAVSLQNRLQNNGADFDTLSADGTLKGDASKLWGQLVAKVSNDVDETLVSHLEEAEDRCLHSVQDAIEKEELQAETKALLRRELSTLQRTHDHMKSLKDEMKAA